ncbi:hypothetical protein A2U10_04400 [Fusobacterium necrophorum subsp. funduliforme]|uniref:GGDEF domain-containing protein n=3 Tax=Fusobacterium necrophorum TaxID=859 RepID=A0AAN4ATG1_9FUSO|nr:hypothetical protein [Fusobacterium necrophorum]AYV94415.1 hypothetical protein BWX37_01765 [Fusobacterium necrophorum subsp. funduliforme]EJU18328.1 hypothetical protein HMPREF1127_2014 [Fusobacterium necrophorum subsp. funduliforme Fnf 1007]KYL02515.1 hypothetical protein A2J05_01170 [Fusobacterium necrophorum subsp. funduliforme]KYL04236.1 hypothetical protein A2J06_01130 [Fusobacterium necrophorum subsp. funduliforme]KYM37577.1 hypothetical protein A2U10_04400 [Fusobacterium necrophorum
MENVVAIAVEKVQRYIFQKIDQSQKDDKTLRDIILASNDISKDILINIQKKFGANDSLEIKEKDKILWISGKVIFCSELEELELRDRLKELYQQIYRDYQGNIFLNFIVFEKKNLTEIEIVQRVNQELKNNKNKTTIIAENQELLFEFQEIEKKEQEYPREDEYLDVFLSNMDDLVILDDRHKSESTNGKIAIVKADINNLGNIMKKIKNYIDFQELSKLLEENISISQFAQYIRKFNKPEIDLSQKEKLKILPFYIAGDDIFYAVRISDLFNSIKCLHDMIKDINSQIQKLQIEECKMELSLAVGVIFVNNHQPIRYYRQAVEEELKQAKKVMKSNKALYSLVGISMAGNLFHIYKDELGKGENEGFIRFCTEIKELRQMMQEKVFSRTALHNLLINLEIERDCDKQMLYVLYFCKPNLLSWNKIQKETYVKYYWLSHLVEDKRQQEEKGERFFIPEKIRDILIPKLKLILLLLKDEYCIQLEDKKDKYIISTNQDDQKRRIRSVLFHKPINYILNRTRINGIERLFFVKKQSTERKQLYLAARFEPSIFFRAKKLMAAGKKEQVLNMFKNYNQTFNQKREENESIHVLPFDERNFEQEFQNIVNGDTDWLDRLILLYQYNQQRIILKTTEKNHKI